MQLEGQNAVVTGASGNLGEGVLRALLSEGARVLAVTHSAEGLARLGERMTGVPGEWQGVAADLSIEPAVEKMAEAAGEWLGEVDVLVNAAGGYWGGSSLWETTPDQWHQMLQTNLHSAFLCTRALLPGMVARGYGRIVNIASRAAFEPRAGAGAYAVSKAAVVAYTRALREDLKGTGVSAVALAPSVIDSPQMREALPKADPSKWVTPGELAQAIVQLVGREGALFSGGILPAYGDL